jgi:hypothetical protein
MGGPDAHLRPEEASRGLVRLALEPEGAGNGAFVDHLGRAMGW